MFLLVPILIVIAIYGLSVLYFDYEFEANGFMRRFLRKIVYIFTPKPL